MLRTESMLFEHCIDVMCVASAWHGMVTSQRAHSHFLAARHMVSHMLVCVACHIVDVFGG